MLIFFLGRSSAISSSYSAKIFLHFFSSAKTAKAPRLLPAALFSVDICTTDVNCIDTGYHLPNVVRVAGYEELVGLFRLTVNGEILKKNNSEYIR